MFSWLGYNEWFAKTRQFISMLCCFKTSSLIGAFGDEFIQIFYLFSASWITKTVSLSIEAWECPGCTRSDDNDGKENVNRKAKGLMCKTTPLHVHHTFFAIFFHDYDAKISCFMKDENQQLRICLSLSKLGQSKLLGDLLPAVAVLVS